MGQREIFSGIAISKAARLSAGAAVLGLILTAASCDPQIDDGPLVTIAYDHSLNFQSYRFEEAVITQPDNDDFTTIVGLPDVGGQGVWMVYNICEVNNPASIPPEDFTFELSKFFVVYQDQQFFYDPEMAAYTYENSQGLPATPFDIDEVGTQFRKETQLGNDTDNVADGSMFNPPTRIAIYVTFRGIVMNGVDLELPLRYSVTPNIMEPRNQTPAKRSYTNLTQKRHLPIVCRPPLG